MTFQVIIYWYSIPTKKREFPKRISAKFPNQMIYHLNVQIFWLNGEHPYSHGPFSERLPGGTVSPTYFLLFNLHQLIYDRETDPEPDPPYFTSHAIKATFDYLTSCHPGGKSLVSLLCSNKVFIGYIILTLRNLQNMLILQKIVSLLYC